MSTEESTSNMSVHIPLAFSMCNTLGDIDPNILVMWIDLTGPF